jgi:hypothetical protein
MNSQAPEKCRTGLAYAAGILGSFLIVAALAWAIHKYTQPAPLGEDRAASRSKALAEMRGADADALNNTAWIDPAKGIVRLRIVDAMRLVERDWQNPAAGRSNLIERVEKATAPPPKVPEKPSAFE